MTDEEFELWHRGWEHDLNWLYTENEITMAALQGADPRDQHFPFSSWA